ncbi:RadC protein [[Mannheimia] succiniciproducens MBEL55E]|uniref:RadC protein n=1 Tax=Mannheimia succiniciproducens (strain KCTC 0769BP / MBEL55E) TaxID=221988 RepID=Q65R62_MANSM|nr:RadC protein [[Mannheimia] succiniciproducens MBEL55E]
MTKRYLLEELQQNQEFNSTDTARIYLQTALEQREREIFLVLFLDNQHRLIKQEEMFLGTINSAVIHPREIIKTALYCNAAAMILAHNHLRESPNRVNRIAILRKGSVRRQI